MKPLINTYEPQGDLFKVELDRIVDTQHGLVRLAATVDWSRMEELFGKTYCPDNGRPGIPTRLMVGLHYLKYTYNLSDEDVVHCQMWCMESSAEQISIKDFMETLIRR